jgi:hypothetical protein
MYLYLLTEPTILQYHLQREDVRIAAADLLNTKVFHRAKYGRLYGHISSTRVHQFSLPVLIIHQ